MAETSIRFEITEDGELQYRAVEGTEDEVRAAIIELEKIAREAAAEAERNEEVSRFMKAVLAIVFIALAGATLRQIPIVGQVKAFADRLRADAQPLIDRYRREEERIQGIIEHNAVRIAAHTARNLHRVGLIVSESYRSRVERFYEATGQLSRKVFGEAAMLNSSLNLLRLAIQDTSRLSGEPVDIGDIRFFQESVNVLDDVEANAARYARRPDRFWFDFNERYLNPELRASAKASQERTTLIESLAIGVSAADAAAEAVDNRFVEYRKEVDPFLSPENRRQLDKIRKDYNLNVTLPINRLSYIADTIIPPVINQVRLNKVDLQGQDKRLEAQEELTAEPSTLDEPKQIAQGNRFSDILSTALGSGSLGDQQLEIERSRYLTILRGIQE